MVSFRCGTQVQQARWLHTISNVAMKEKGWKLLNYYYYFILIEKS